MVLCSNSNLGRYQYVNLPDWSGRRYASPTAAGSRSGGLTAATWTSMIYHGEEGYLQATRQIMNVADALKAGIGTIPELTLIGDPTFVISFRSDDTDI